MSLSAPMLRQTTVAMALALAATCAAPRPASALINYEGGKRIGPPPAEYLDRGYRYYDTTRINGGMNIPIAPNFALAAKHVAPRVGTSFVHFGITYTVTGRFDNPGVDVSVVRVDKSFESSLLVPLYRPGGESEVGKEAFIVTRGGFADKAGEFIIPDTGRNPSYAGQQAGWRFTGAGDSAATTWGMNRVAEFVSASGANIVKGDDYLFHSFDAPGTGDNVSGDAFRQGSEAMAGSGDSGGGVFIEQDGEWRLAGTIWAIGAGFYSSADRANRDPYTGAFYDTRGMYYDGPDGQRVYITDENPVPNGFFAARLSKQMDWILQSTNFTVPPPRSAVTVPEAGSLPLASSAALLGLAAAGMRRRRRG